MNVAQLIEEINKDIDDVTLELSDHIGWINRALDDLTPIANQEAKTTYLLSVDNAYLLPEDIYQIVLVNVNGEKRNAVSIQDSRTGYQVWANTLSLQPTEETGQMELYYYKSLRHVAKEEDIPEIPSFFHDLLVLYTVAHQQFAEEETERQIDALNRYNQRKQEFRAYVSSQSMVVDQVKLVGGYDG